MVLNGRYVVERDLAEGGMALVYQGRDRQTGRVVAIKSLFESYSNNPVVRERFLDEGRIQMMLKHPNILQVHEVVYDPALAFVMELVQGGTLEDELQRGGPLPEQRLIEVTLPVMSALGMAHSRGIIHRDLKPSNILMARGPGGVETPKVMDFGVAKMSRVQELTATGTTVGTLHYMSPEQIVGSKKIDGRADIYSMGITLYKLATGEVPFNASSEFALMMAQVESLPRPPREINPAISLQLQQIILKALEKRPSQRFQTIKAFTEALIDLLDEGIEEVSAETVSVPNHLMRYALMSDEVAVDRTDQVVTETLTDQEREVRTRNISRARGQLPAARAAARAAGLVDDAGNATVEIDAGLLREIRVSNDAVGEAGSTVEMPTVNDGYDDAETALVERPAFARKGRGGGYAPGLDLGLGDVTTRQTVREEDISGELSQSSGTVTTPVAASAFDRPPSVFGPMDVDTSDETRPNIVDDDFAKPIRVSSGQQQQVGAPGGAYPGGPYQGAPQQFGHGRGGVGLPGPPTGPPMGPPPGSGGDAGLQPAGQRAASPAHLSTQHLPEYQEPEEERGLVTAAVIFVFVALAAFGCTAIAWIVYHKLF